MDRRTFVKSSCILCAALGGGLVAATLTSCSSIEVVEAEATENTVRLPLSLFQAEPTRIVRLKGSPYTIAVHRMGDREFHALLLRCTHADNRLDFSGNEFTCSLHGSRFDLEGAPLRGPAVHPLHSYTTALEGEYVVVSLAG